MISTLYIDVTARKGFYYPYTRACGSLVVMCACSYSNKINGLVEIVKSVVEIVKSVVEITMPYMYGALLGAGPHTFLNIGY